MIKIFVPFIFNKLSYTINYVFFDRLGLEYIVEVSDRLEFEILVLNSYSKKEIRFPLSLWDSELGELKVNEILALEDVCYLPGNRDVPVIQLEKRSIEKITDVDVFGFIFFMLSRVEELNKEKLDEHQRFPAKESFAFKHKFLNFPVVDWYIELIVKELQSIDVYCKKKNIFTMLISCDVDYPTEYYLHSFKLLFRKMFVSLVKERKLTFSISLAIRFILSKIGGSPKDLFTENIRYIMNVNEKNGNRVIFYFIPHNTSTLDSNLSIRSDEVLKLCDEIRGRGHLLGIHPSYESTHHKSIFEANIISFKNSEAFRAGEELHCRTHFLKWDVLNTPEWLESNNINIDSSIGYADLSGFRCGTCHPFKLYDLKNDRATTVNEFPLICMDASILSNKYEGLNDYDKAWERTNFLKEQCRQVGGTFTLLWHNSSFENQFEKKLYEKITKAD